MVTEDRSRVLKRSYHLIHKLLVLRKSCKLLQANSLNSTVEECCRVSLILWLFYILGGTSGTPPKNCTIRVRIILLEHSKALRSSIDRADQVDVHSTRWGPYNGLFFWIIGLGTLVAEDGSEDDMWFRKHFTAEAKCRCIYTYGAYASTVIAYLPLDRLELVRERKLARTLIVTAGQSQLSSLE
jgi:hypothetical protein